MTDTVSTPAEGGRNDAMRGFLFALSAYGMWGVLPLYMKLVAHIPAPEVVAHRVLWSVPIAAIVLLLLGRTKDVRRALRSPRTLAMAALTAAIISTNWGLYIWAISVDRTVDTALGYYINPLVSIAMAAIFLGEKLDRYQLAAVALATIAVLVLTIEAGGLPWISLSLAFTFAVYGFLRKTLPIGPSQGFFLEVLILTLPALGYLIWLTATGVHHFRLSQPGDIAVLLGCGPATAVPLLLFAFGAKLLRYSTVGIMQYIAPTLIFLIAVFVFKEPFDGAKALAFVLIWAALAIYSLSLIGAARRAKK